MCLPDEVLVQKTKKGDLDAFDELVRRYEAKIYGLAYRFMGNHADASDLTQDTFIRLYKVLAGFRGDAAFSTWLYRIAANICRDELRKRQRRRSVSMDEMIEASPANMPTADDSYSPEETVQRREVQRQVQICLSKLSEDHRLILIMREIQGLSYEEIADVLQCSLGTVKSRISRARNALKEKMRRRGELLPGSDRHNAKGGKNNAMS
ncbi:RNA polymerase sigma factor [Desulfoscipio sp. XC116]|uniref:RNA polymerase sigma factor n=1 Tax=Desulfoscipio sp. XC116 TaxID=3144975 RepID=UPI00325B1E0F